LGQVARDFDLIEPAVREWVKQVLNAGARVDDGLTRAERSRTAGRPGRPVAGMGARDQTPYWQVHSSPIARTGSCRACNDVALWLSQSFRTAWPR